MRRLAIIFALAFLTATGVTAADDDQVYSIRCVTETAWVNAQTNVAITVCPNNAGHTVKLNSVRVINSNPYGYVKVGDQVLQAADVTELQTPAAYANSANSWDATTSTGLVSHLTLVTADLDTAEYYINWYYEWKHDTKTSPFLGRLMLNDEVIGRHRARPAGVGVQAARPIAGTWRGQISGVNTVAVKFATGDAADASYIRRGRILIGRIK